LTLRNLRDRTIAEDVIDEDQYVLVALASDWCNAEKSEEEAIVIETGSSAIFSVAFHPDGKHLFSGSSDGVQRWQVVDGQEVGEGMRGIDVNALSVSEDHKWIVCGTVHGASVWDAKTQEKAIEVEGTIYVAAVDISPDSTRFVTGTREGASIWNILTGGRLVGPLQHDGPVRGVKFSPNGERLATFSPTKNSIHVFGSYDGDQLIEIGNEISHNFLDPMTPFAWSSNGQQIFAVSSKNKIKSFDVSTGFQLAECQVHDDDPLAENNVDCITLASNGKFLATFVYRFVTFWDTSTLARIGPVIEDNQYTWSIALSPHCNYLATGRSEGNITIRNLSNILPDLYGPFLVSTCASTGIGLSDKLHIFFRLLTLGTYPRRPRTRHI